jgi:hypothetical protein
MHEGIHHYHYIRPLSQHSNNLGPRRIHLALHT